MNVLFEDDGEGEGPKVGILFERKAHCAVLDVARLAQGDIAFGSNSWRGDRFEPHLRAAVARHDDDDAAGEESPPTPPPPPRGEPGRARPEGRPIKKGA